MNSYKLKKYSVYFILIVLGLILPGIVIIPKTLEISHGASADRSNQPNIIIILADDVGYGDLGGYYGGKAKTPHLNSLSQEGYTTEVITDIILLNHIYEVCKEKYGIDALKVAEKKIYNIKKQNNG